MSAVFQHVDDEVAHYLEQAESYHRARGLSAQDARRAARIEVGNTGLLDQRRAARHRCTSRAAVRLTLAIGAAALAVAATA